MIDPLTDIIGLLRPTLPISKLVHASGSWRIRRSGVGKLFHSMVLSGSARFEVAGRPPIELTAGDFVLVPEAIDFTVSSQVPPPPSAGNSVPVVEADGSARVGEPGPAETQQLVGYCSFASEDKALLLSLLPDVVVVSSEPRLEVLARLIRDEVTAARAARTIVLEHLLQLLLIEALRSSGETSVAPSLLGGLADPRLGTALRALHAAPAQAWTVAELARRAGMSRSAFFTHFRDRIGPAPMQYLTNWRMALAKDLLTRQRAPINEVATRVGYGSPSAFNAAFTRAVGCPPSRFARMGADASA